MNVESQHLLRSAQSLSASVCAEIAVSLIHSLDAETSTDSAESVDAVWTDEIKQRIKSIDNGEVELVPWNDVMHEMREHKYG